MLGVRPKGRADLFSLQLQIAEEEVGKCISSAGDDAEGRPPAFAKKKAMRKILTSSHSIVLKNGCVMISMKLEPDSRLQPSRSTGFLFRKPLRMEAAFTLSERGMRMVFSRIT